MIIRLKKQQSQNHFLNKFAEYIEISLINDSQYIKVSVLGGLNSAHIKLPLFIKNKNINKKKNKGFIVYLPKYTSINIRNEKNINIQ